MMLDTRPSLTITRFMKAPPAKVFAAWTDPEKLLRWFGPDSSPVLSAETDPRPGGKYGIRFCTADGEEHFAHGEYVDVVENVQLVFTWKWITFPERESLVTVQLRPVDGGTELTLIHEKLFDEEVRDSHHQGWSGCLDKLEAFVAS
ncbi:SRPBCC domain-containing protein [Sphingomonas sp. LaA6.9]|uniref:SRPBCC family protein n=1 Tax=Sphingomonas sp. LaA6.9 TaxID=2919914 RepID=UPI001F4F900F|nr:SRPBCC domain-containing protein [Sphingomonas sp. LaA6.9]MCJ8156480.1 SRPBCC domain-containing protein [Sphingomonas sp. LaA6.9]